MASGATPSQSDRRGWAGSPGARLRRNTMSVTTAVPSRLKASDGRRIAPTKSAFDGEVLADGGVLLVEREMRGDQGQHAAGLQGVDGLGEEEIVQGQLLAAIVELEVGEGHVADHRVDAVFGQRGVAEILDADVVAGVECSGDPAGDGIQFDADEACPGLAVAHEIAGAAAGLQDGGVGGHAQAGDGLVDGGDDGGRRVEGVEGGALGAVVFLGRKQRLQLLAEGLPAGVLVAAGDRIGKNREGDRPEAGEAGECLLFFRRWRAAALARWPSGCGWRRGCRGPWTFRRWRSLPTAVVPALAVQRPGQRKLGRGEPNFRSGLAG